MIKLQNISIGISLILLVSLSPQTAVSQESASVTAPEIRAWVDGTGREIRAALTGFEDKDTLMLRMENGRTFSYPIDKLSAADQTFARAAYERQGSIPAINWDSPTQSENYTIKGIRRENAPGFISTGGGWELRVKCIEARVEYKGDRATAPGEIIAYFYDRDGKLILKVDKLPRRQDESGKYIEEKKSFENNKTVEAYFPLTEFLEESGWATVLIVFGTDADFSVQTMPGKSLEHLAFDEKEYVFPGWSPDVGAEPAKPAVMAQVQLEVRRIGKVKYPYSVTFNGGYSQDVPCISAEVRAVGELSPGDGTVKMYLYDGAGKLVGSKGNPSSAQVGGTATYLGRPHIADDRWHPVVFSLDRDLEEKKFETVLLVFQFGGKTFASVESAVGATISNLDFPEKKKLSP